MEIITRKMNVYSSREKWMFLNSLKRISHPQGTFALKNSTEYFYEVTIDGESVLIGAECLQLRIMENKIIDLDRKDLWAITYRRVDNSELKNLYEAIFNLEFEKVPLILNSFPEVAKWRLLLGK